MSVVLSVLVWLVLALGIFLAAFVIGAVALPPMLRGWYGRLGATPAELTGTLPGDEIVPAPRIASTKAITIAAPAELVRQLIVQMGYQRGGWYGWDWFYKMTGSAEFVDGSYSRRVVPELQDLAVGDTVAINKMVRYEVVQSAPDRLVLVLSLDKDAGVVAPDDPAMVMLESWVWAIQAVDDGTTRLILRIRTGGPGFDGFVGWLYDNPLDLGAAAFGYKTLRGIKRVAERLATG